MNKKYIFFDIDGTIYSNGVVDDAKNTIIKLKEKGHKVFICTGRATSAIDESIIEIGFDGIIAACGLYISIGKEIIVDKLLPDEILQKVKDVMLKGNDFSVILEGKHNIYFDFEKQIAKEKKRYEHFIKVNKSKIKNIKEESKDIYKFGFRILDGNIDYVVDNLGDYFDIMQHSKKTYEAVPRNYSKASAILEVIKKLGVDISDTIAVGDGINDIPMFKIADTSILIGDNERVLPYVDLVSEDVTNNGVGNAFRKLGMI